MRDVRFRQGDLEHFQRQKEMRGRTVGTPVSAVHFSGLFPPLYSSLNLMLNTLFSSGKS